MNCIDSYKSVSSFLRQLSTCHCSYLLLSAVQPLRAAGPLLLGARRPPLSFDISCPHGAQQQTRRTPRLRSNDGKKDGRTLDRFIDPASHTMRQVSISYLYTATHQYYFCKTKTTTDQKRWSQCASIQRSEDNDAAYTCP